MKLGLIEWDPQETMFNQEIISPVVTSNTFADVTVADNERDIWLTTKLKVQEIII